MKQTVPIVVTFLLSQLNLDTLGCNTNGAVLGQDAALQLLHAEHKIAALEVMDFNLKWSVKEVCRNAILFFVSSCPNRQVYFNVVTSFWVSVLANGDVFDIGRSSACLHRFNMSLWVNLHLHSGKDILICLDGDAFSAVCIVPFVAFSRNLDTFDDVLFVTVIAVFFQKVLDIFWKLGNDPLVAVER